MVQFLGKADEAGENVTIPEARNEKVTGKNLCQNSYIVTGN